MGTKINLFSAPSLALTLLAHSAGAQRVIAYCRRSTSGRPVWAASSPALRVRSSRPRISSIPLRSILTGYSVASGRGAGHAPILQSDRHQRYGRSARLRRICAIQRTHPGERPAFPSDLDSPSASIFRTIPLNSVDHIEITRGNSGAVLYGDGAIGGVINIVTKTDIGSANRRPAVEGAVGSSMAIKRAAYRQPLSIGPVVDVAL